MKKILMIGNLVFIPVEYRSHITVEKVLYLAGSISGTMFGDGLYTEAELRAKYPNIKEANGFKDMERVYHLPE